MDMKHSATVFEIIFLVLVLCFSSVCPAEGMETGSPPNAAPKRKHAAKARSVSVMVWQSPYAAGPGANIGPAENRILAAQIQDSENIARRKIPRYLIAVSAHDYTANDVEVIVRRFVKAPWVVSAPIVRTEVWIASHGYDKRRIV